MYKQLAATAVALLVCAAPMSALAGGCPPIVVADADGGRHKVRMNVVDCAEASAIIRGQFNSTRIDARDLARVLVNMIGRRGRVSVEAYGDAQVGTVIRGSGTADIDSVGGQISAQINRGSIKIKNVGDNTIILTEDH